MNKITIAERNTMDRIQAMGGGQMLATINHINRHGSIRPLRKAGITTPIISGKNLEDQLKGALHFLLGMNTVDQRLVAFCQQALGIYANELQKVEMAQAQVNMDAGQASAQEYTGTPVATSGLTGENLHPGAMVKAEPESSGTTPEKPNASVTAREVINKHHFRLYLNGIYFWDHRYKLVNPIDIKRLLNGEYRQQAEIIGGASFYDRIIEFVLCEKDLVVDDKAFEAATYLIAFRDGYLNTKDMSFHAPDPRIFFTSNVNLNYEYGPGECPNFDQFLANITGGDPVLTARIFEMVGLALSNDLNAKALFCLQGVTNSAKSTLISFIASFFDKELVTALSVSEMDRSFALSDMIGKAVCMDTELPATPIRTGSVMKLKQLTSKDMVNTDIKYKDRVSFISTATIFLATNHPFQLDHRDDAFMKRVVAIPFYYEIPKTRVNPEIRQLFEREKLAIAKKAIAHYIKLRENNYIFSGDFRLNEMFTSREAAQTEAEILSDRDELIRAFLDNCCTVTTMDQFETTDAIHKAYTAFCEQHGAFPATQKLLTSIIKEMLGKRVEPTKRRVVTGENPKSVLLGIKLKAGVKTEGGTEK